jgi:hypothetical protein
MPLPIMSPQMIITALKSPNCRLNPACRELIESVSAIDGIHNRFGRWLEVKSKKAKGKGRQAGTFDPWFSTLLPFYSCLLPSSPAFLRVKIHAKHCHSLALTSPAIKKSETLVELERAGNVRAGAARQ